MRILRRENNESNLPTQVPSSTYCPETQVMHWLFSNLNPELHDSQIVELVQVWQFEGQSKEKGWERFFKISLLPTQSPESERYWPAGQERQIELYRVDPAGQVIQVGGLDCPRSIAQDIIEVEQYEAKNIWEEAFQIKITRIDLKRARTIDTELFETS